MPMTDITPLKAIDRLHGKESRDNSLFSDISRSLGLKSEKVRRSEQWKEKLRRELVQEHLAAKKKKASPVESSLRKFFRLR